MPYIVSVLPPGIFMLPHFSLLAPLPVWVLPLVEVLSLPLGVGEGDRAGVGDGVGEGEASFSLKSFLRTKPCVPLSSAR